MEHLNNIILQITKAYPSVIPYLRGRAGRVYCEHKQKERDPKEPGLDTKNKLERRLKLVLAARMARQYESVQASLQNNFGKAILASGIYVPDDPAELDTLIKIFYDGILSGVLLAEESVGFALADGSVNQAALRYAKEYVTKWLSELDATSQNAVRDALETFVSKPGATIGDAVAVLQPVFGTDRAWRIATTETTRIYAEANQIFARELASQYPEFQVVKRYYTNNDDRVCPICGPLDGKEAEYNDQFEIPDPPLHPNCRCWTSITVKA